MCDGLVLRRWSQLGGECKAWIGYIAQGADEGLEKAVIFVSDRLSLDAALLLSLFGMPVSEKATAR